MNKPDNYGDNKKPYGAWQDESNHYGVERDLLSVQERFEWMEITIILRKNGGYMPSGLGGRLFPVIRLAGRQTKISFGC